MEDMKTHRSYHHTLVVLGIDKEYDDIPADVEAKLMTRGLASSYIELKLRRFDGNEPSGPFLNEKSRLQGSTAMTSEFIPEEIQKKLEDLVDGLRTFIKNANDIVGDPNNKKNLQRTLANLSEATNQATQTFKEFQEFSAAGTTTFKNADAKIEEFVTAAVGMSEELSKATVQLRQILEKVNTGQGTAARFVNDGKFYESMLENSEQMQLLLKKWTAFIDDVNKKGRLPIKLKSK
jgi:ABC-type transporter Mla subunit MlaD